MSRDMEQETPQHLQQYIEGAKTGIEIAQKTGILKRVFSLVGLSRSGARSVDRVDYQERALQALQDNAVETFANIELTVGEASQILEPGFLLDDLDKVNSTWQRHWMEGASKVGIDDDERRTWWARLLAGEIQQPGTFSLRTVASMNSMSTKEAEVFTIVSQYVWQMLPSQEPKLILPEKKSDLWTLTLTEQMLLENAGLVNSYPERLGSYVIREAKEQAFTVTLTFHGNTVRIEIPPGNHLKTGTFMLTSVGAELFKLTTPEYQQAYFEETVARWRESLEVLVSERL